MQQPADIDGKLRRLRAGQEHAVVERVQETLFADPTPALDDFALHEGDLSRRAAERDKSQLDPEAQRLRERDAATWKIRRGLGASRHTGAIMHRGLLSPLALLFFQRGDG